MADNRPGTSLPNPVPSGIDSQLSVKCGVANSDLESGYLGLSVQRQNDFDAIENCQGGWFQKESFDIGLLPTGPTLRQHMDARAADLFGFMPVLV